LLKQAAEEGDVAVITDLWAQIPAYIKKMPGIAAIYFAAMISAGVGGQIETELATALSANWNVTLLVLYGSVQSENPLAQFEMAERWLDLYANDAVLLMVLGKLCGKNGDNGKAKDYLLRSIAIEATVQAYQLLGDLSYIEGDKDQASHYYKQGLELASMEVVSRIDSIS
jgi:Uncharacterized enzyme of heme biosynthesis